MIKYEIEKRELYLLQALNKERRMADAGERKEREKIFKERCK